MNKQIIATIDIGSNTVALLIVEIIKEHITVIQEIEFIVQLGQGLSKYKIINQKAIKRFQSAMYECSQLVVQNRCSSIYCVSTEAVRQAKNKDEIIKIGEAF